MEFTIVNNVLLIMYCVVSRMIQIKRLGTIDDNDSAICVITFRFCVHACVEFVKRTSNK